MSFYASDKMAKFWNIKNIHAAQPLDLSNAVDAKVDLETDARSLIYSALISIADASRGLERKFYSWTIVKMYYASFYLFQAFLAIDGICMFRIQKDLCWTKIKPGALPQKAPGSIRGSSHKFSFYLFRSNRPNHALLSQTIGILDPHSWLIEQREIANYRQAKFVEPDVPPSLNFISQNGLRKTISAYAYDKDMQYCFDADHAIFAYPLEILKQIRMTYPDFEWFNDHDNSQQSCESYLSDKFGVMPHFRNLFVTKAFS